MRKKHKTIILDLDIETKEGPKEEREEEFVDYFNKKGNNFTEFPEDTSKLTKPQKNFIDKFACKNSAEIVMITAVTPISSAAFYYFELSDLQESLLDDMLSDSNMEFDLIDCENEADLLIKFTRWADMLPVIDTACSWNGSGFDFPKILGRSARYDLDLPAFLMPGNTTVFHDLQKRYSYKLTSYDQNGFYSLDRACKDLRLPGKVGNGSEVGEMLKERRHADLIYYGMDDTYKVRQIRHRMRIIHESEK